MNLTMDENYFGDYSKLVNAGYSFLFGFGKKDNNDPFSNMRNNMNNSENTALDCSSYTALIVDDNVLNIKVAQKTIEKYKFKVDTATSAKSCIEKISNGEKFDIIFMDYMMPEMDGIETLREIKKLEKYTKEHTPVIALTANAIQGAQKEYIDAGFDDYLTKPVQGADLERMIVRYLPKELINK